MHLNFKLRYFLPSLFYYTSVVFIPCSTKHKLGTNILFCPVLSSPVEVLVVLSQLPNAIWVTVCVVHAYTPYAHVPQVKMHELYSHANWRKSSCASSRVGCNLSCRWRMSYFEPNGRNGERVATKRTCKIVLQLDKSILKIYIYIYVYMF